MKKILVFVFLIIRIGDTAFSQGPLVKQWDKRFGGTSGDWLTCFNQTADGGYILGGSSRSDSSGDKTQDNWDSVLFKFDYWIVKIDSWGNKLWDKDFGGIGEDYLYSLQQTSDGGYILGGLSNSDISGDKTQNSWGVYDYWVIKIDSLGNKQWDKDFGGLDDDILYSLTQTSDWGFLLGGKSISGIGGDKTQNSQGGYDYWIVKIDSLGNKEWDKDFGGADHDMLSSLRQTSEGGYILGGYSESGISGDKTQANWDTSGYTSDYWIVKIDSLGNIQFDKDFGGNRNDYLNSIQQTSDGGYISGGYSYSLISGDKTQNIHGFSDVDFWIVKIDSIGNKEWDKDFGGTYQEDDFGIINQTTDKGYLLSGTSYSNVGGDKSENNSLGGEQTWIVKTDSMGIKQWDKTILTYGHDEVGFAIQTRDGCYAITNSTWSGIGGYKSQPSWNSYEDYWIIKFCDSTQIVLPVADFASPLTIFCSGNCTSFQNLSLRSNSWQWIFQGADDSTSIDANPQNICYNTPGTFDVTLISFNNYGSDTITLPGYITVYPEPFVPSIIQSADTLIAQTGYTSYQWYYFSNLIPGATDYFYVATQNGDYSVVVTDSNGCDAGRGIVNVLTGENSLNFDLSDAIRVVPNPSNMMFRIVFNPAFFTNQSGTFNGKNIRIEIADVFGKIIYSEVSTISIENDSKLIRLDAPSGIYFVNVFSDDQTWKSKIIIQN